jgi:chromate reductase
MKKILALSGSIRKKSTNTILLEELVKLDFPNIQLTIYDQINQFPFFNPDLDMAHVPVVKEFCNLIQASDMIIISSPEYVHSLPGVLKNALDWLVGTIVLEGKPIGLIFASSTDARYARESLIEILKTMSAKIMPETVINVPGIKASFDTNGNLSNPQVILQLQDFLKALASQS